jgi:HEAT repeat protein
MPLSRLCLSNHRLLVLAVTFGLASASAQDTPPTPPDPAQNPDAQVVGGAPPAPLTPEQLKQHAWEMLSSSQVDVKHTDVRIQGLAALGLMGNNPRSLQMIGAAMTDPDVDVRTAAVLAAGQTKAPEITSDMRRLLDDKEPQVAYGAALSLWKLGDHSGEDILMAVIDGERRASATLMNGTEHTIDKDLHSPSTLAKIGVLQGAGMLLGPFGFGITAYEYIHRNGGDSARVNAIEAISQEKTEPIRKELLGALDDKDPSLRAAAAKALDSYHQPDVSAAIAKLFDDPKQPVRLTSAAAYLISTGTSAASPDPNQKTTRRPRSSAANRH